MCFVITESLYSYGWFSLFTVFIFHINLFSGLQKGDCRPFVVAGLQVGLVRPSVMAELNNYPEVFIIHPDAVVLNPAFRDYNERTINVENVLKDCKSRGTFITLKGWRDEVSRCVYSQEV